MLEAAVGGSRMDSLYTVGAIVLVSASSCARMVLVAVVGNTVCDANGVETFTSDE